MMWADRAGVGLIGLAMIVVALLLFGGTFGPLVKAPEGPWTQYQSKPAISGPGLLSDEDLGITPTQTAPIGAAETFIRIVGFVVLPAWLVLRIGDWVFAGPARRRAKQQERITRSA